MRGTQRCGFDAAYFFLLDPNERLSAYSNLRLVFCCVLDAELLQLRESGGGLAGVDGFGAEGDALFKIVGEAGGDKRRRGVEQDNVAARAGNAGEHVVEQSFVGGHVAAGELVDCGAGQARPSPA